MHHAEVFGVTDCGLGEAVEHSEEGNWKGLNGSEGLGVVKEGLASEEVVAAKDVLAT